MATSDKLCDSITVNPGVSAACFSKFCDKLCLRRSAALRIRFFPIEALIRFPN